MMTGLDNHSMMNNDRANSHREKKTNNFYSISKKIVQVWLININVYFYFSELQINFIIDELDLRSYVWSSATATPDFTSDRKAAATPFFPSDHIAAATP